MSPGFPKQGGQRLAGPHVVFTDSSTTPPRSIAPTASATRNPARCLTTPATSAAAAALIGAGALATTGALPAPLLRLEAVLRVKACLLAYPCSLLVTARIAQALPIGRLLLLGEPLDIGNAGQFVGLRRCGAGGEHRAQDQARSHAARHESNRHRDPFSRKLAIGEGSTVGEGDQ